jgi:ATP-dependent RNA helicase DeaD
MVGVYFGLPETTEPLVAAMTGKEFSVAEREAGVVRAPQHVVHVLPHAPSVVGRFLAPALERVSADAAGTQLLILTPDADTALAIANAARGLGAQDAPVVPVTSAGRGGRLLASRVTPSIAAAPSTLVALMRNSAVKLDAVRTVVIAWANEMFDAREDESLEIVLAEIPKEASRVLVTDAMTPAVEALVERHLRRASRQGIEAAADPASDAAVRYVTGPTSARAATLRRLLDELDPPSVIVIAAAESVDEARSAIAGLGYEGNALVRVETAPVDEQASLVVLYDLPTAADVIAKVAAASPAHIVALIAPRQIPALRRLTTGVIEPLDVTQVATKARVRDERLRSTLRAELEGGFPSREIMALEPLLAEFDGIEIAAAALRLLERDRSESRARRADTERPVERATERPVERKPDREAAPAAPRSGGGDTGFTRIFLTVGERDGVRAGDLVGAIAGESGITSDRIGKLEIRDGHTIAEIAAADAATVIEKMNGVTIKGRRVAARLDERPAGRPREGREGREGRDRREGRRSEGPRGFREGRGAPREGGRGGFAGRHDRPPREGGGRSEGPGRSEGRFSRERPARSGSGPGAARGAGRDRFGGGDRPPRRDDAGPRGKGGFRERPDDGRVPRATREREEWSDRADRVRNARRPRRDET